MKSYTRPRTLPKSHPADMVWAAASLAFKVNGGYYKESVYDAEGVLVTQPNRTLVEKYLAEPSLIAQDDFEAGAECRKRLGQDVTLRALKGTLTDFEQLIVQMHSIEQVETTYQLAVITSMAKVNDRLVQRISLDDRLAKCVKQPVGDIGTKVEANVEVVAVYYSQKFFTWFVTAITSANQSVFFSYRESLPVGRHYDIRGNVKAFNNSGTTQLNRVKLVNQE